MSRLRPAPGTPPESETGQAATRRRLELQATIVRLKDEIRTSAASSRYPGWGPILADGTRRLAWQRQAAAHHARLEGLLAAAKDELSGVVRVEQTFELEAQ